MHSAVSTSFGFTTLSTAPAQPTGPNFIPPTRNTKKDLRRVPCCRGHVGLKKPRRPLPNPLLCQKLSLVTFSPPPTPARPEPTVESRTHTLQISSSSRPQPRQFCSKVPKVSEERPELAVCEPRVDDAQEISGEEFVPLVCVCVTQSRTRHSLGLVRAISPTARARGVAAKSRAKWIKNGNPLLGLTEAEAGGRPPGGHANSFSGSLITSLSLSPL